MEDKNMNTPNGVMSSPLNDNYLSHKLVILGDVAVGKSSIAQRFVNGKFNNLHEPTVGALFMSKKIIANGNFLKFDIWDTAGQERFRSLTPMYYRNANAAVVVFDISNGASFERAQKWMSELLEKANPGIVIALCGNKVDLEEERQVAHEEAEKYASQVGSFYIEVSAKINLNIEKLFQEIGAKLPKSVPSKNNIILTPDPSPNQTREGCTKYICSN